MASCPAPPRSHRPAPRDMNLRVRVAAILTAHNKPMRPKEIADIINRAEADRLAEDTERGRPPRPLYQVSPDTIRSILRRLAPQNGAVPLPGGRRWQIGAGQVLEREMRRKEGAPLRPPSVTHDARVDVFTPVPPARLQSLRDELDATYGTFLSEFRIPRLTGPKDSDRARQFVYVGVNVRVVVCANGRATIYPKNGHWLKELSTTFPEIYQEASGKTPTYMHREYPRKSLEGYLYKGGDLTINVATGSNFPASEGGDFALEGTPEAIAMAEASLSLQARSEAITIEMELKKQTEALRGEVQQLKQFNQAMLAKVESMQAGVLEVVKAMEVSLSQGQWTTRTLGEQTRALQRIVKLFEPKAELPEPSPSPLTDSRHYG